MARLHALTLDAPPRESAIPPERCVEGAPQTRAWTSYALGDGIRAGTWAAEVGAWRVAYDRWEFCEMLAGVCELVPDDGPARRFRAGDAFVVEAGFVGVWRVLEPMTKRFVILTGDPDRWR